jgi:hypothetical protein
MIVRAKMTAILPLQLGVLVTYMDEGVPYPARSYENWDVRDTESFLQKAQQDLIFAEMARDQGRFDIEASRLYYAIFHLACELARIGKLQVSGVDPKRPWGFKHGRYSAELEKLLKNDKVERVVSSWYDFRQKADYEPGQVSRYSHWKNNHRVRRDEALEVARIAYETLQSKS